MLRCGFYEMDITPFAGCRIPGSFEKRTVQDVTDTPYAKAVVIDNGEEKVAIVCSDILYIYGESYKKILDRICALTDLKRQNIMVTATHNHSGGPTDYDLHTDEDKLYVEMAWRKAADAVIFANQRLQDATAGFGGVEMEGCNFVRDFYMKDGSLCTQPPYRSPEIDRPESDPDPLFTVLSFRDPQGKPLGAIANFALSALLSLFMKVFGGSVLTFLFQFALIFGLFALALKLLFPNRKLKELLTKRNLLGMAVAALILTTADMLLKTWYEPYEKVRSLILLVLALVLLSLLAWRILYKRKKPEPEAQEAVYEIV